MGKVKTSQLDITNVGQEVSISQQVTKRHQLIDAHARKHNNDDKKTDIIDAFNTASRFLDDINNVYFDKWSLQSSNTEAAILELHLAISNDIVST